MGSLQERLAEVRSRVAEAAQRSGRRAADIRLVAVSKTIPPEVIVGAYRLGQTEFGENRVQEFREKRAILESAGVAATFHMVGHLQTNKARLALRLFDIIQSVDSPKLARVLDREAHQAGRKLPVLLEVDFSTDPDRTGFDYQKLDADVDQVVGLPNLEIQGLMTVAPLGLDEKGVRTVFRRLRESRERLAVRYPSVMWTDLSMGMSDDFETAIEEGATIVRVGRAIFGERRTGLPLHLGERS